MAIQILPQKTASLISAHQIIPDPFVLIKELIENSIDANSSSIKVGVYGNLENIRYVVQDNGNGIEINEHFLREGGTSKTNKESYGCKGAALSSLIQVADIKLNTKCKTNSLCASITTKNSICTRAQSYRSESGTTIEVFNFHKANPVREMYIAKNISMYIKNIISVAKKYSIVHKASIVIERDGKVVFSGCSAEDASLLEKVAHIYSISEAFGIFKAAFEEFTLESICTEGAAGAEGAIYSGEKILESTKIMQSISKIAKKIGKKIFFYMSIHQVHPEERCKLYNIGTRSSKHHRLVYREFFILSMLEGLLSSPELTSMIDRKEKYPITRFIKKSKEDKKDRIEYIFIVDRKKKGENPDEKPTPAFKKSISILRTTLPNIQSQSKQHKDQSIRIYAFDKEEKFTLLTNESDLSLAKEDLLNLKVVGQFNTGFIIATLHKNSHTLVYAIDQHAADEAINYEHLKLSYSYPRQTLIKEVSLHLSEYEKYLAEEHIKTIEQHGFILSPGCLSIIQAPMFESTVFGELELKELLNTLKTQPNPSLIERSRSLTSGLPSAQPGLYLFSFLRKLLATKACRSSIMIGDSLTHQQMSVLLDKLGKTTRPWNCPHGRPTIVLLKKPSFSISSTSAAGALHKGCPNTDSAQ